MFENREELEKKLADVLPELAEAGEPAYVFAFFDHRVAVGQIGKDCVTWQPDVDQHDLDAENLIELRAFGPSGEWRVWRTGAGPGAFESRKMLGPAREGDITEYHALWGHQSEELGGSGWHRITEERGIEYTLPIDVDHPEALRLCVIHRVVDDERTGLANVVDSRLAGIVEVNRHDG